MTSYITGAVSPPQSLGIEVQVTVGRNQIQRQVGNYAALYKADKSNIQSADIEVESLNVWSSNPQETYQELVVSCSGVLTLKGIKADNTPIELQINRLLVLDSELKTFTLSNINEVLVRASIHYVTTRPT